MNGGGCSLPFGGKTSAPQDAGGGAEVIGRSSSSCDLPANGLIVSTASTTTITLLPGRGEDTTKKTEEEDAFRTSTTSNNYLSEASVTLHPLTDQLQVFSIAKYTCELCCANCVTQFSFFEHLKSHYETLPSSTSDNCAAANEWKKRSTNKNGRVVTVTQSEVIDVTTSSCTKDNLPKRRSSKGSKKQVSSTTNSAELIENAENIHQDANQVDSKTAFPPASAPASTNSPSSRVKMSSSTTTQFECPHCQKRFRKEKNFTLHNCKGLATGETGRDPEETTSVEDVVAGLIEGCQNLSIPLHDLKSVTDCIEADSIVKFDPCIGDQDDEIDYDAYLPAEEDNDDDEKETEMMYLQSNICPSCDEHFQTKESLDEHISQRHPEVGSLDPMSDTKIDVNKKSNAVSQVTKKSGTFQCQECLRIFNHRNSLVYHMRSHTGERPYKCDHCGKCFFATSALKVHQRVHTGSKPYECKQCHMRFRQWGDLRYHQTSIHSNTRAFQCEYCGKDFARKYSLTVHRRIHTNERNYKCDLCDKSFRAASYLQNHRRIHTGEKNHGCQICGKAFRVKSDMNRHYIACLKKNPGVATVPVAETLEPEIDSKILPVISAPSGISILPASSGTTVASTPEVTYSILTTTTTPVELVHENLFAFATS